MEHGMQGRIEAPVGRRTLVQSDKTQAQPAHKAIKVAADGSAVIEGRKCVDCGAVVADATMACRACGSRTPLEAVRAGPGGKVFSWSVIHRSYPGVPVPFVSAIVDLDGGLTLKGTLRGIAPEAVQPDLAVEAVIDDAGGILDKEGRPYVGFHFVPKGVGQ